MDYTHSSNLAMIFLGFGALMAIAFVVLMVLVFRKPTKTLPSNAINANLDMDADPSDNEAGNNRSD